MFLRNGVGVPNYGHLNMNCDCSCLFCILHLICATFPRTCALGISLCHILGWGEKGGGEGVGETIKFV